MASMNFLAEEGIRVLLILICVDYALAVLNSIRYKRFSSEIGVRGVVQKLAMIVLLFAAYYLKQTVISTGLIDLLALQGLIYGLILTELASIRRNLKDLGLDFLFLHWVPKDNAPSVLSRTKGQSQEDKDGR